MSNLKTWLKAARLRTLPLAAGGILLGSFLAAYEYAFSWPIFLLAFFTAILLQILSNLANDYGDFIKGTDQAAERTDRALASGAISLKSMKNALWLFGILTLLCGLGLLTVSFQKMNLSFLLWFLLGLGAIAAAIKYTIGQKAYGYSGFGDIMVFIFFGPVAVVGTYCLMTGQIPFNIWIPAKAFGALCVAVLNINNLRDLDSDKLAGKKTIAVRLGFKKAIIYQYLLFAFAIIMFILFTRITVSGFDHLIPIIFGTLYFFITFNLAKKQSQLKVFNVALKQVSILNLLFIIILGLSWLAS